MHDDDVPLPEWRINGQYCDGCGARAYARVRIPSTGDYLHFCVHHWKRHASALTEKYATWWDESAHLYQDEADMRKPTPETEPAGKVKK